MGHDADYTKDLISEGDALLQRRSAASEPPLPQPITD
jgi:hypothetical protein